jgi:hypothetical protein
MLSYFGTSVALIFYFGFFKINNFLGPMNRPQMSFSRYSGNLNLSLTIVTIQKGKLVIGFSYKLTVRITITSIPFNQNDMD